MGLGPGTFHYVFVPADPSAAIEQRQLQQPEGQEVECLTSHLQAYFKETTSSVSQADVQSAVAAQIKQQIAESNIQQQITDDMLAAACDMQLVESCALLSGGPHSGFVHVNLYVDDKGQAKNLPQNERATGISIACGVERSVFGDAFIGRVYEDKDDFYRMDFLLEEVSSSADWVKQAKHHTMSKVTDDRLGKLMEKTGAHAPQLGALRTVAGQLPAERPETTAKMPSDLGGHTWFQESDEIIVHVACPANTKSKDVKVTFKPSHLKVEVATLDQPLVLDGELFQRVCKEDCNWTIETAADLRILTATLTMEKEMNWLMLLRS